MVEIKFNCPHCQQSLEASEDMAGDLIDCPTCSKAIQVPSQPKTKLALKTPQKPQLQRPAPAQSTCRYCGAVAHADAVLCISCGRNMKTGQQFRTQMEAPVLPNRTQMTPRPASNSGLPWGTIVLVILLAGGGWWVYNNLGKGGSSSKATSGGTTPLANIFGDGKEDDQFYEYSKVKAGNAKTIKEKTDLLSAYMQKYPNGKHAGEMKALLEQAQEELAKWEAQMKVGSILADCRITLGSGQTVPVQGWLQLIKTDQSTVLAVLQTIQNDQELKKLLHDRALYADETSDPYSSLYWHRVGKLIAAQLKGTVLAQGQISEGKLAFTELQPGYYLLYGAGMGGRNVVTYFKYLDVEAGKTTVTKDTFGSVFNADFVLETWRPL